jgi:hypothetical protein
MQELILVFSVIHLRVQNCRHIKFSNLETHSKEDLIGAILP